MYEVVGLEMVDYVNKQNKRVQGVKIHCFYQKFSTHAPLQFSFW